MPDIERISPTDGFAAMAENGALLVATYASGFKFEMNELSGAIASDKYFKMESGLSKNRELIFY